jgi:hypothetical protein
MGHSGGLNHLAVASAPPPRPAAALQGVLGCPGHFCRVGPGALGQPGGR